MTVDEDLPCRELVELVTEHLEGALPPRLDQLLRDHLAVCAGCTDHVDQVRTSVTLSAALPLDDVPDGLRSRLAELHREHSGRRP